MAEAPEPTVLTKPIVLVGPMGVGKTTVGKKLAKVLKLPFIDTDSLIIDAHGPIPAIFETEGEPKFREYEEQAVAQAISNLAIVATGGGAVLSEATRRRLGSCHVIYLSTSGKHIASRLTKGNRPLVKNGMDDWRRIYESRKPTYEAVATIEVDTSGKSLANTIAEIRKSLNV